MRHQCILDTVDRFHFRCDRVHPVNGLPFPHIFKRSLVFRTEQRPQIDMPVTFVLLPPIEINMERSINRRFDEAKTFCYHHDHSISFKRKCKSPTCVNSGWLARRAKSGAGGTRGTIFTAEYSSWA